MPEQFQYPEEGWSTGGMRKVGEALDVGAAAQRKRFKGQENPDEEIHNDFSKLPEDWSSIHRQDDGTFLVKRSLDKASPKELRSRGF